MANYTEYMNLFSLVVFDQVQTRVGKYENFRVSCIAVIT